MINVAINNEWLCEQIGRTSQGYLAAAWTADSAANAGWQPTRYAQYWDPMAADRKRLVPLDTAGSSAFSGSNATGAGLKNPRGPITTKMLALGPHAGTHLLLYHLHVYYGLFPYNP